MHTLPFLILRYQSLWIASIQWSYVSKGAFIMCPPLFINNFFEYWILLWRSCSMRNLCIGLIEYLRNLEIFLEESVSFCFFNTLALFTPVAEWSDRSEICIRSIVVRTVHFSPRDFSTLTEDIGPLFCLPSIFFSKV